MTSKYDRLYKNRAKGEQLRAERTDVKIALRKDQRDEQIAKERCLSLSDNEDTEENYQFDIVNDDLDVVFQNSGPDDRILKLKSIRKQLNSKNLDKIDQFIVSNETRLPHLATVLETYASGSPMFTDNDIVEVMKIIQNITVGTVVHSSAVMSANVHVSLLELIGSSRVKSNLKSIALTILGNISGDSSVFREIFLEANLHQMIIKILELSDPLIECELLQTATWTLSMLLKGRSRPQKEYFVGEGFVTPVAKLFFYILQNQDKPITLKNILWVFAYYEDCSDAYIGNVLAIPNLLSTFINLLKHPNQLVISAALRAVGNIATGSNEHTDIVLQHGALPVIQGLLKSSHNITVKESCWIISNIAAGTRAQVMILLETPNLIQDLLYLISTADWFKIQRESCWALANVIIQCPIVACRQLLLVFGNPLLSALTRHLCGPEPSLSKVVLKALSRLLKVHAAPKATPGSLEKLKQSMEELDILNQLETLAISQHTSDDEVSSLAARILDAFFTADVDGEGGDLSALSVSGGILNDTAENSSTSFAFQQTNNGQITF